jgi:general secretion pathway protein M
MKQYLEQFKVWWNARLPRERQILAAGAAVVAVLLFYSIVWNPVVKARHRAEVELRETRAFAHRLETIAVDVERMRGTASAASTRNLSLLTAVGQAARQPELGKEPSRIEPDGEKEVKVWIDDVPFDALVAWLQQTQTQFGIVVSSAELERKADGVVTARLSMTRP